MSNSEFIGAGSSGSATDKDRMFDQAWIESSYLETLFPSTPWQNVFKIFFVDSMKLHKKLNMIYLIENKINDMLCSELAKVVRQQFNNPHRKQMIIELLGSQFKRSYLTDEIDNPNILVKFNLNKIKIFLNRDKNGTVIQTSQKMDKIKRS